MHESPQIDHPRRRRIYEYVERNGAVTPETVRKHVLVRPQTDSKPARSGADLDPSVPMSAAEFEGHVTALEEAGHLATVDGTLRVAHPIDTDAETVPLDDCVATVRAAREEDISGLVDVIETIAADDRYVVAARLAEEIARDDVLLRHNESESRVFFVATVDDDPVGWLHVRGGRAPKMGHTATLTLGVLEGHREHGLGATLVERGLAWARDAGYRKVYQHVPATNDRAIDFLEAQGWSTEATREGHYRIDDELVDEVQLAVWLDD